MLFKKNLRALCVLLLFSFPFTVIAQESSPELDSEINKPKAIEEITVWGKAQNRSQAGYTNPTSLLTPEDFNAINVATTEDIVKFEPSIVIRRRYIGDSNGTLGLRGSNMFQTSRSMVFADGVPLHYLLQSRWNGAPRWTLVSASEIAQAEIIYGPFSAEYSGNAMGGVVNIETAIPQEREIHADVSYFSQSFDAYGFDDSVSGYKSFFSYGDKIGDVSVYLSYNRLENDSQPQSFYLDSGSNGNSPLATASGSIIDQDRQGILRHYFSDSGIENDFTNNYKIKIGYEFGNWSALLNVAYEDRTTTRNSQTPYLQDAFGNPLFSGSVLLEDGSSLSINSSRLAVSELDRDSLNIGLRLKGSLSDTVLLEANINQFDVRRDETRSSNLNPLDPAYTLDGRISDYDDTGWQTADAKLIFTEVGIEGMEVISGLKTESYELGITVYNSSNYLAGSKDNINNSSGGETALNSAFVQMNWDLNANWDVALGGRYELWETKNGFYRSSNTAAIAVPDRDVSKFSPKISLGYTGFDEWTLRYSIGKAYRFPIVEELYDRQRRINSQTIANPNLEPENGLHHNVMLDYNLDSGYLRMNVFHENIVDAIESFTDVQTNIRTFHAMGEIETTGVELVAKLYDWLAEGLSVRFNLTYTDSEIIDNPREPEYEGKTPPRMPQWRSNLMASYEINDQWQAAFNVQYADKSFGGFDNTDTEDNVFGAQDGYTRFGVTSHYNLENGFTLGLGIDNLTNEIAYVAHPWPGRTVYGNVSYEF